MPQQQASPDSSSTKPSEPKERAALPVVMDRRRLGYVQIAAATQRVPLARLLRCCSGLVCLPRLRPRPFPGCLAAAPLRLHRLSRARSPLERTAARGCRPSFAADRYQVVQALSRSFAPASRSRFGRDSVPPTEAARENSSLTIELADLQSA